MTYQGWYKPSRFPTKFPSKRDRIKTYNHTINAVLTTTIQQESNISKLSDINSFFWRVSGWFSTARTPGEQRLGACCSWLLQAWRLSGGISWPSTRENAKLAQKITCWVEWAAHHGFEGLAVRFWDVLRWSWHVQEHRQLHLHVFLSWKSWDSSNINVLNQWAGTVT